MRMHKDEIIELLESLRIKEDITDSEKTLSNINKIGSEYSNSLNDPSIHENGIPFHIYDDNNETITLTTESQQVCGEDKAMKEKVEALTHELRKKQETIDSLKQQLEELRKCHNDLKEEYDSLQNKSVPESGNQRLTDCENEEIIKQARKDGMRELVEQLIVYAENENQEAAREIKFALMAKMVNCIITPETLTPELKERLDNLGRKKENNMIFYNSVGAVVANASQVSFPNNKE